MAQTPPTCSSAEHCRQLARDAIAAGHFESAHDWAWLAYQKGSKQDPATLSLIARTQSLSGRGDDAFVMLRRLAETGVIVEEAKDSDDFRAVRSHPQWPQLLEAYEGTRASPAVDGGRPRAVAAKPPKPAGPLNAPATPSSIAPPPPPLPTPPTAPAATPTVATVSGAAEELTIPPALAMPAVLAYDSVSARFVMGSATSDALTVLSQTSTNAAPFTSRGWSGHDATTAIAIDRAAGDLWVAVQGTEGMALHRLQLISGRRLEIIEAPTEPKAEFVTLVSAGDGLYALDAAGRRVYRRAPQSKKLDVFASFAADVVPTALAYSRNALYVAHANGVLRVDTASRRQRAVATTEKGALARLHSIAWHDGVLYGVQRSGDRMTVVRIRLNGAGTTATNITMVGPAASVAATMSGGVYYYVANSADGNGAALRGIAAK
jgi:hypothetical protein